MKPEDIRVLVATRMGQATDTLRDAKTLLAAEPLATRSVVNRAYYAAFYAVLALLQTIGKTPSKHSGALSLFDLEFVRTGHFAKEMSNSLHQLFQARIEDDYKRMDPVSFRDAQQALETAQHFVNEVRTHLRDKGLISPD